MKASRHSDLDLILVQKTDLRFLDRYDGLLASFSRALPEWDVDILIYTPEELAEISNRRFIQHALQEGKILYELKASHSMKQIDGGLLRVKTWTPQKSFMQLESFPMHAFLHSKVLKKQ